jgi:phosphoribosylformimino-5-aminoimidazole carboxamide ribotide isomerase
VIGVIDLLHGRAVHARGGRRDRYEPLASACGFSIAPGDAVAVARAYLDCGIEELYVADLDAIMRRRPAAALVAAIAGLGAPVWLDAGVRDEEEARRAANGVARVIVGLETLPSLEMLTSIGRTIGNDHVAFSLDLRDGMPIAPLGHEAAALEPAAMARLAAEAGIGAVIVLDLARVGANRGLDVALIGRIRSAVPGITLVTGGGVRGIEDLKTLADAGCDGALVATALHEGRLTPEDLACVASLRSSRSPIPDPRSLIPDP